MSPTGAARNQTLGDLGERRIVREILGTRYRDGNATFGDDVADFGSWGGVTLVATTDPAPTPVIWDFLPRDYFDWGWLVGAINLSDIAASGARPLGLLTSLTLASDTTLADFRRLLDGVDAVCSEVGTQVRGGNLKESQTQVVEATAIGVVDDHPLSRLGADAGDFLYAFGDVGAFWAALLMLWANRDAADRDSEIVASLARPRPLVGVGRDLLVTGAARACMDASDGLYSTFVGLTADQGLGFQFEPDSMEFSEKVMNWSRHLLVEPARLALGFGNFELVCAAPRNQEHRLRQIASRNRVQMTRLGRVTDGNSVTVQSRDFNGLMSNFDNERFSADSQFTSGLSAYRDRLLTLPLA